MTEKNNEIGLSLKLEDNKQKSCCSNQNGKSRTEPSHIGSSRKKNSIGLLTGIFAGIATLNILVMGYFTVSLNSKLNQALELSKPQKGNLTLVLPVNCSVCGDLSSLKKQITAKNIEVENDTTVSADSMEGKNLIGKFKLNNLPALIFESGEKIKGKLAAQFKENGRLVGETSLVWEQKQPPYFNTQTNSIAGLVDLTYITDKNCAECYDVVKIQKPILRNFGVALASENTFDISDKQGRELIKKYSITSVPTIILSPDAKFYQALSKVWPQVGSIESDGAYVFRQMAAIQAVYKDLDTGRIVKN